MDPPPAAIVDFPVCATSDWHVGMTRPGSQSILAVSRKYSSTTYMRPNDHPLASMICKMMPQETCASTSNYAARSPVPYFMRYAHRSWYKSFYLYPTRYFR